MSETREGGCLCGAVRFRTVGDPAWIARCHCQSCRRHSGAPMSVFVAFDERKVEVTEGAIAKFASSPDVLRGFCARCGSTISCEGPLRPGELHIHVGAFDAPEDLAPAFDLFAAERLPWLHLAETNSLE